MFEPDGTPECQRRGATLPSPLRWILASNGRAFLFLFLLGFGARLFSLTLFPPHLIPPNPLWETGAVAISLAEKGTFADPYLIPTGPTSHIPPLWTGAMSMVYRAFGTGYTGGLIRWILSLAASAALWASLPVVGEILGLGLVAGLLGGLTGALAVHFPSEVEPLVGLTLAGIMVAWVKGWGRDCTGLWRCLLHGLLLGIALHLKPALLLVVLGFLVLGLWMERGRGGWYRAGLVGLGILIACVPWGWRNYAVFQDVFFIRGNFGLELAVGNHPGAHPDINVNSARGSFRHPRTDMGEAERVRELGERRYMAEKEAEALEWIRENPGEFLRLTLWRVAYFWGGRLHVPGAAVPYILLTLLGLLGLWWAWPELDGARRGALVVPLFTYPLVYYILAYMPRYGEPVRWILFLLAGSALWRIVGKGRWGGGASQRNSLG